MTNQADSNTLPNSPFFTTLLSHALTQTHPCIRDSNQNNQTHTYADLLSDVLHFRSHLTSLLPPELVQRIRADSEEICIGILSPGGYEYVVGLLAVLALGAAVVPMTTALPVAEAGYFVRKSRQVAVVTSPSAAKLGNDIVEAVNGAEGGAPFDERWPVRNVTISPHSQQQRGPGEGGKRARIRPQNISINSEGYSSPNAAGIIIFTSGTTGPPKGAVIRRGYIYQASRNVMSLFALTPEDTLLHLLPVHHVTGLAINILPFLLAGACIEFRSGGFDPKWTWDRWRDGAMGRMPKLGVFSGVPTIYQRMMRYFESTLSKLPERERKEYEDGAGQFRVMLCGTSALPRPVAEFWRDVRGGQNILTRYGSTEVGAVLRMPLDNREVPDGSVGEKAAGVELKLVDLDTGQEGDEGEIWVKTPERFARYLHDEAATTAAYTEDGWFRTGDVARREGRWYWIVGRASQDIIKSGGYKISALDVEREILALPYVGEIMVARVPDEEFGERVAAALSLRDGHEDLNLTLERLREDLREHMVSYKMPTLLRVIKGELPKTATGKVLKKILGPQLFPSLDHPEVQVWRTNTSKL